MRDTHCVWMMVETLSLLIWHSILETHTANVIALLFIYLVCFSFILPLFCTWFAKWKATDTQTHPHTSPSESLTRKFFLSYSKCVRKQTGYYLNIMSQWFVSIFLSLSSLYVCGVCAWSIWSSKRMESIERNSFWIIAIVRWHCWCSCFCAIHCLVL